MQAPKIEGATTQRNAGDGPKFERLPGAFETENSAKDEAPQAPRPGGGAISSRHSRICACNRSRTLSKFAEHLVELGPRATLAAISELACGVPLREVVDAYSRIHPAIIARAHAALQYKERPQ